MTTMRKFNISKEELNRLYQRHSMAEIAKIKGVGETVIHKRIHEYGITLEGVGRGGHRKKKGKVFTEEHRKNISAAMQGRIDGENNPNWKGGPLEKQCLNCKKEFKVTQARNETAKFCSNKCLGLWKSKTNIGENHPCWQIDRPKDKKCEYCKGLMFQGPTVAISTFRRQKFCSKECSDKGGFRYSGEAHPNYKLDSRRKSNRGKSKIWQREVFSRDAAQCQNCGAKDLTLHAHHIESFEDHPEERWNVDNGITLCFRCHWSEHSLEIGKGSYPDDLYPVELIIKGRPARRWEGACDWCNKFLSKRWSDAKGHPTHFCNKSCAQKYRMAHITKETRSKMRASQREAAEKGNRKTYAIHAPHIPEEIHNIIKEFKRKIKHGEIAKIMNERKHKTLLGKKFKDYNIRTILKSRPIKKP
jgi:5-methylcytosine-specific restriction endonuclease McrA